MQLSKYHTTLFSLLRSSLWPNRDKEEIDFSLSGQKWHDLFEFTANQGVLALTFEALPERDSMPGLTKELYIRWGVSARRIEERNRRQVEALKELITIFRDKGIEVLLLKGLDLAQVYPRPAHRESGDLDIYLFGDYEKGNRLMEDMGIEVKRMGKISKHSQFYFQGIPVDNHLSFLNVELTNTDKNLEAHLTRILNQQGYNTIMLDGIEVRIPTPDFTAIHLARHDISHFLSSGLVLRHICDLTLFFSCNSSCINFESFLRILEEQNQLRAFLLFIEIARRYLGMPGDMFPVLSNDEKLINRVLDDTLNKGYINIEKRREAIKMAVLKRKIIGAGHLFNSKWKYDLVGKEEFRQRFMRSLKALF